MVKFTVSIITRNRSKLLGECLSCLMAQSYSKSNFEVVVIDNCSNDDTRDIVYDFKRKGIVEMAYLYRDDAGIASARNTAIISAKNDFVVFLNDDCLADSRFLENICIFIKNNREAGIIQARCLDTVPKNIFSFDTQLIRNALFHKGLIDTAGLVIKKSLVKKNIFDERFKYACEGIDFQLEVNKTKVNAAFCESAFFTHSHKHNLFSYLKQQFSYGRAGFILQDKWQLKKSSLQISQRLKFWCYSYMNISRSYNIIYAIFIFIIGILRKISYVFGYVFQRFLEYLINIHSDDALDGSGA